jgi:hypothetical protein
MTTFGELRSHLQGPTTAAGWKIACDALDGFPPDALDDQILPYVDGAAKRWPDALRVAPESWVRRTLEGEDLAFWTVVRAVNLSYNYLGDSEVLRLLGSPRLDRVTILNLDSNRIGTSGGETLASAPGLAMLEELHLSFNGLGDRGLETICRARDFAHLRVLDLEHNDLRACRGLAGARFMPHLRALNLSQNPLEGAHAARLFEVPESLALRELDVSRTRFDDAALAELCARDDVALARLDLSHTAVTGSRGVATLCGWSGLQTIEELRLESLDLDDRDLDRLIGSGALESLESLTISHNAISTRAVLALVDAEVTPNIKRLNLRGLGISLNQLDRIQASLGKGVIVAM